MLQRPQLIGLLSPSLGDAKAEELVTESLTALRIVNDELSEDDVLRVLERIAAQPGLVGVAARFAKGRFHMMLAQKLS